MSSTRDPTYDSASGGNHRFEVSVSAVQGTARVVKSSSAEKGTIMFCNGCNHSYLWLIIILIILFGWNGNGCGNSCGCGCGCGCDNNNGCGCGC